MDLRDMLNDSGPAVPAPTPSKQPPQPQPHPHPHQHQQHQQQPALPSTPIQTMPQQSFRDYGQTQPSPSSRQMSDYGINHPMSGAYSSPPPPPYQNVAGPYTSRPPPPPPLRHISPIVAPGPAASPYQQTPSSSISAAGGAYPFPPTAQTPTSPVQRQQFPPTAYHRDSYPQPSPHAGMTGPPGHASYMQGQQQQQQVPQTPPVGPPAAAQPYLQRSQSTHSTPTPTSAQSKTAHYGAPYIQHSPLVANRPLSSQMDPQRAPSLPPTPVAAPLSARQAQIVPTPGYGQPPSPYQQRLPGTAVYNHPPSQTSPPPPPHPSLPRHPSTQSIYDPHSQDSLRRSQSHGDRDRSLSVSPKTRIPSLPSSAGRPGTSVADSESRYSHNHSAAPAMPSAAEPDRSRERGVTPGKRKLEDRELRLDELEKRDVRPPPFEAANGRAGHTDTLQSHASLKRTRKRRVYPKAPVWAQTAHKFQPLSHPNVILYRAVKHAVTQVNGKSESLLGSRHASPEEKRSMAAPQAGPAGHPPTQPSTQPPMQPPVALQESALTWGPLGPWEASITNTTPQESLTKVVADFLFKYVVLSEDMGEIQSRGVQFEIEAKLGTLVDKETNKRVSMSVLSDCVVDDGHSWMAFRSSMTESQHKKYNEFLNEMVVQTHPDHPINQQNAGRVRPRVPIEYKHRREVDRFFELPAQLRDQVLPACVANPIASRKHAAKVRVTYDQKTNEVLAKIIKARIADISLHFPDCPLDCRISINLEMNWDGPISQLESNDRGTIPHRNKDRLSYTHSHYQIDLTQVTQMVPGVNNTSRQDKEHELEIEVNPQAIIDQGRRALGNEPHMYAELVEGLLNNIRVLARKAKDFT
ncbi:CYTH-like domain-containing protein [Podospora didyma]|uniref:mRNA-capping enzyme subunit beta n=1 Tax=Podospora didyma TaxID=330526 RepID=A0AAE0NPT9_9PEZI|nr:CYTH-like domain-containing protein [Podospora didyma]